MEKTVSAKDKEDEHCLHCRHNKDAVKPFIPMKRLSTDKGMRQILDKVEQEGQNPSCYVCGLVGDFIKGLKQIGKDED